MTETMTMCQKCGLRWDANSYPYSCPKCDLDTVKGLVSDTVDEELRKAKFGGNMPQAHLKKLKKAMLI